MSYDGLDPLLAARIKKMITDSGGRLWIVSGYRSVERQRQLYEEGKRKHGANVNKWVAPPGKSNHNHGLAVDMGGTDEGMAWMRANLGRYGLHQPMAHEPWHIELPKTASHDHFDPEAYTQPPIGGVPAGDPYDPGFQGAQLMAILDGEMEMAFAAGGPDIAATQTGGIDLSAGQGQYNQPEDDDVRSKNFGFASGDYEHDVEGDDGNS